MNTATFENNFPSQKKKLRRNWSGKIKKGHIA